MKKRKNWKENFVTALEVPRDLGLKEAVITVSGRNQARIENYRSILRYRERRNSDPYFSWTTGDPREKPWHTKLCFGRNGDPGKDHPDYIRSPGGQIRWNRDCHNCGRALSGYR